MQQVSATFFYLATNCAHPLISLTSRSVHMARLPEAPRWQAARWYRLPREFLGDQLDFPLRKRTELGEMFWFHFYFRRIYVVTDLEAIRHILQVNHRNYRKSPAYAQLKLILGNGLVTSEGALWRRQRRLIQPVFHKRNLQRLYALMQEETKYYCQQLAKKSGQTLDMSQEMMGITAAIALRTLFSTQNPTDQAEMYRVMCEGQSWVMYRTTHPWIIPFAWLCPRQHHFARDLRKLDKLVYGLIEARRHTDNSPGDLLDMLCSARDPETGTSMSRRQIRDEVLTLFVAGHETSATAMSWTLWLLCRHPEVARCLDAELAEVLGGRFPEWDDLPRLRWTRQILKESMRLYPPAYAIGRQAVEADTLCGYHVPARSIMFISIYALHRHPKYYEHPDRFVPEHFSESAVKARPRLAYMPFGAGPRMCVGNHFAMIEMTLLLAVLWQQFRFELAPEHPVVPHPLVTLKPKHGIRMRVETR